MASRIVTLGEDELLNKPKIDYSRTTIPLSKINYYLFVSLIMDVKSFLKEKWVLTSKGSHEEYERLEIIQPFKSSLKRSNYNSLSAAKINFEREGSPP